MTTATLTTGATKSYLTCAETAKLVRKDLKAAFPGVKFSVRSDSYSGGASINVSWTDGPTAREVDRVIKVYAGSGFDGMQDLKYSYSHWLMPDGTVTLAKDHHNLDPRSFEKPSPEAVMVSFGADFVFSNRKCSNALRVRAADSLLRTGPLPENFPEGVTGADCVSGEDGWNNKLGNLRNGNYWFSDTLFQTVARMRGDGTFAFDRYGHDLDAAGNEVEDAA